MIRPLRARHRRMIVVLALVVPMLLVAALAVRRPAPTSPDRIDSSVPPLPALEVELARGESDAPGLAVRLRTSLFDERPDILPYWSPVRPVDDGSWTARSHLLGSGGKRFDEFLLLPEAAQERDGWLVLYSVAHREVVAEQQLSTAGGER